MEYIIKITNLSKTFKNIVLYKNLNFFVEKNSITAITGKNGTGKTTLLKILAGQLLPDEGEIFVNGINLRKNTIETKKIIGFSINAEFGFYPHLTLKENFYVFCKFYNKNITEFDYYINELCLRKFFNTQFVNCSNGIKQKFSILMALINNPKIVLIDEITKSIDNDSVSKIYELIKYLKTSGKTIIFVTHNLQEINLLADNHYNLSNGILQKIG